MNGGVGGGGDAKNWTQKQGSILKQKSAFNFCFCFLDLLYVLNKQNTGAV